MELFEGCSLAEWINSIVDKKQILDNDDLWSIILQLLSAMH